MSRIAEPGDDLDRWLTPFLDVMGRSTRRRWGPLYVRGLLGPDGPKSVQPIAARLGLRGHDQLHHFVTSAAWDDAPLWRVLAEQADRLLGGPDAVLVIDDTGMPKKGTVSVGVAPQYCGELGKQANCQSLVSLTLARHEVPVPISLRLFVPKVWTDDHARCAAAGIPEAARASQTKPEIALAEIDRVVASGMRFGFVLADAGYGLSAPFRQGLRRARPDLVGRHPTHAEGLHDAGQADMAECWSWASTQAAGAERAWPGRGLGSGRSSLAPYHVAPGHEGRARGPLCSRACARRRWPNRARRQASAG